MPFRRLVAVVRSAVLAGLMTCASAGHAADGPPAIDLNAYRGQVVLLDFWASWCAPCRESFPWMVEVGKKYRDRGFAVLGVNLDKDDASAKDFLHHFPVDFKIVFDASGALADQYHLMAMPSSFLIDRAGRVRYRHQGFRLDKRADYEAELETLLDEK